MDSTVDYAAAGADVVMSMALDATTAVGGAVRRLWTDVRRWVLEFLLVLYIRILLIPFAFGLHIIYYYL